MSHAQCTCASLPDGFTCHACTAKPRPKATPKHGGQYEIEIQRDCVAWFRKNYRDLVIVSHRNEQKNTAKHVGTLANRNGRHAGTADLQLIMPSDGFHGFFIEMKRPGQTQERAQKEFERYVTNMGYLYRVCDSLELFKKYIIAYTKIQPREVQP